MHSLTINPPREIAPDPLIPARFAIVSKLTAKQPVRCTRCRIVYKLAPCVPEMQGKETSGCCLECAPLELARFTAELETLVQSEAPEVAAR